MSLDQPTPPPSKAQRIAAAIHRKTVIEGKSLHDALWEVKAEFEAKPDAPSPPGPEELDSQPLG
jgi:hypothetical protein